MKAPVGGVQRYKKRLLGESAGVKTDPQGWQLAAALQLQRRGTTMTVERVAKAIREEIIRQYRDDDRGRCPAGVRFWEEEVQPMLLAQVAMRAFQ